MSGHPLRKYARYAQKAVVEAGLPKPGYQWCLAIVQRVYDAAKADPGVKSIPDLKANVADRVLAFARMQQQVEGRYKMPSGGVLQNR